MVQREYYSLPPVVPPSRDRFSAFPALSEKAVVDLYVCGQQCWGSSFVVLCFMFHVVHFLVVPLVLVSMVNTWMASWWYVGQRQLCLFCLCSLQDSACRYRCNRWAEIVDNYTSQAFCDTLSPFLPTCNLGLGHTLPSIVGP